MANELLEEFLAQHIAADGKCSCGWDVADYDLEREWLPPMSATDAWCEHIRKASYRFFEDHRKQYVETVGPDGETVAFVLERSTLLLDKTGLSLDYEREHREQWGYQYDGYEPPPRDPDGRSDRMTCEEAGCRNPYCSAAHMRFSISFPPVCAGCGKGFAADEERQGMYMQAPPGTPLENGTAVGTAATYHVGCVPGDAELKERADELWPKPPDVEPEEEAESQAMACLSCGLAGTVPEEHFPQEPGLWDRPCPECGASTVWVTEVVNS